jgi:hypothetical protein
MDYIIIILPSDLTINKDNCLKFKKIQQTLEEYFNCFVTFQLSHNNLAFYTSYDSADISVRKSITVAVAKLFSLHFYQNTPFADCPKMIREYRKSIVVEMLPQLLEDIKVNYTIKDENKIEFIF